MALPRLKLPFFLAKGFVASETMEGALPVLQHLSAQGLGITVDVLGEHIKDRSRARASRDTYIALLKALAECHRLHGVDNNISIKLSMIGQVIDEDFCLDNLLAILNEARRQDAFVRLDMEGTQILDSTLRLFEAVYPTHGRHVGVVLQAYLKRTRSDVERMCDMNARVRLVKGAYKEPERLAYQRMDRIHDNFVACMKMLLSSGTFHGIATHDDRLLEATRSFAQAEGVAREAFEFQMLYRIRPQTQLRLVREGYRMRVYVPYGEQWFPYYFRRLRERKENVFFLLSHAFRN